MRNAAAPSASAQIHHASGCSAAGSRDRPATPSRHHRARRAEAADHGRPRRGDPTAARRRSALACGTCTGARSRRCRGDVVAPPPASVVVAVATVTSVAVVGGPLARARRRGRRRRPSGLARPAMGDAGPRDDWSRSLHGRRAPRRSAWSRAACMSPRRHSLAVADPVGLAAPVGCHRQPSTTAGWAPDPEGPRSRTSSWSRAVKQDQ